MWKIPQQHIMHQVSHLLKSFVIYQIKFQVLVIIEITNEIKISKFIIITCHLKIYKKKYAKKYNSPFVIWTINKSKIIRYQIYSNVNGGL